MNEVAVRDTDEQYRKLQKKVRENAVRAMRNNKDGNANYNLHRVKAIPERQEDGTIEPVVAKVDTKLRPGTDRVEQPSVQYYAKDQLENIEDRMIDERVEWSSSPFVDRLTIDCPRPEENVWSGNDVWSFGKDVEDLFEGFVDFDALGNDLNQSRNIPKGDLSTNAQDGVNDVREEKKGVIATKTQLIKTAKEILEEVIGAKANRVALNTKTPDEIYDYVDKTVESEENPHPDVLRSLDVLHTMSMNVDKKRSQTEEKSIEVFSDVLSHSGYGFPSSAASPGDMIVEHGVGQLPYLGI